MSFSVLPQIVEHDGVLLDLLFSLQLACGDPLDPHLELLPLIKLLLVFRLLLVYFLLVLGEPFLKEAGVPDDLLVVLVGGSLPVLKVALGLADSLQPGVRDVLTVDLLVKGCFHVVVEFVDL